MGAARKIGLDKHDIGDLAHEFGIKHRRHCRDANPKGVGGGSYVCVCDFMFRIIHAVWRVFDGEGDP